MKSAFKSSIQTEEKAVEDRFMRADNVLAISKAKEQQQEGQGKASEEVKPVTQAKEVPKQKPASRPKVIRRTFSITEKDYTLILELKKKVNLQGQEAPQSELIRAGIHHLSQLSGMELVAVLDQIEKLKPGRPQG